MTKISNRAHKMPESPIRKLMPYAKAAEKEGKKVFYLNIGQPDIDSPACAIDALKTGRKIFCHTPAQRAPKNIAMPLAITTTNEIFRSRQTKSSLPMAAQRLYSLPLTPLPMLETKS